MKIILAVLMLTVAASGEQIENRPSSIDNSQSPTPPAKWQNPQCWRNIRLGQSPDDVRRFLGDPAEGDESPALAVWYYASRAEHPKDAVLVFRKSRDVQTLQKIMEPNWQTMPAWQRLQADYQKALADQRAADLAEKRRLAAEAAAKKAAEREAFIAKQRADLAARTAAIQNQPPRQKAAIPPAKPDTHTQLASRYFIMIGISFVVIAFIIAGSYGFRLFKT